MLCTKGVEYCENGYVCGAINGAATTKCFEIFTQADGVIVDEASLC